MTEKPTHSPLGASAAERWMNCPGSIALNKSIVPLPEAADPEYRKDGTAAHAVIAYCLTGSCPEPWELIGETFEGVEVTVEMADAVQVFLTEVNPIADNSEATHIEEPLSDPDHPMMYGTIDFGALKDGVLYVRDFKYGMGIVVETEGNVQMLYYAYLLLLRHPDARKVNMRIIQPRLPYAADGAWEIPAEQVIEWAEKECFPAMERTATDTTLNAGEHCRFCDAKAALACPKLQDAFAAFTDATPTVARFDKSKLLADWSLVSPVKMHIKAIEDELMRRLMANELPDNGVAKLVNKKANRVWKSEAPALFQSRFPDKCMTAPELKSPAEMEKIGPDAKKMVHEYAYTPQSGYTVAPWDDKRAGVVIQKATAGFAEALDTIE